MFPFQLPSYVPDSRANRIEKSMVAKLADSDDPIRWLYVCGPDEVAAQIKAVAGNSCREVHGHPDFVSEYTHCFEFENGIARDLMNLVELLKGVLSLTRRTSLDFALALDWYKLPDPELDPMQWPNSEAGELVHRGKYWSAGSQRDTARVQLVQEVSEVIRRHPLLRGANAIVTVPGHNADGRSFGEQLAARVAGATRIRLVQTASTTGPRSPSKEGGSGNLEDAFNVPINVTGDVVILDDVYRSGGTMSAVALAARRAGARRVFGLAAVRTLRN